MAGIDPISNVADAAAKIVGLFKADPNIKPEAVAQMDQERLQGEIQIVLAQLSVDKQEAASANWFVAGWRPAIGWVCGAGLAYGLVLKPALQTCLVAFHIKFDLAMMPTLDAGTIMGLLTPMLGLGLLRTYEKTQDVHGKH